MLNNLKIAPKLILSFLSVSILVGIVGFISFSINSEIDTDIMTVSIAQVERTDDMTYIMQNIEMKVQEIMADSLWAKTYC